MARVPVTRRFDLTDTQWAALEPLLPTGKKPGRPPKWSKRQLIDGVRWRARVGSPWRDVPACYGPWQTVYGLFRRWQRAGVWQRIVTGLQTRADAAGLISWDVSVDSTIARAHQHAASRLYLAEATVKRHLSNIFTKLGAVSRVDAVNKAVAAALIPASREGSDLRVS